MSVKVSAQLGDKQIIIETGKLAKQADGAVTVQLGETIVVVAAVAMLPIAVLLAAALLAAVALVPVGFAALVVVLMVFVTAVLVAAVLVPLVAGLGAVPGLEVTDGWLATGEAAGAGEGLPVGVQVLAPALGEGAMFRAAAVIEHGADPQARGPIEPRATKVAR